MFKLARYWPILALTAALTMAAACAAPTPTPAPPVINPPPTPTPDRLGRRRLPVARIRRWRPLALQFLRLFRAGELQRRPRPGFRRILYPSRLRSRSAQRPGGNAGAAAILCPRPGSPMARQLAALRRAPISTCPAAALPSSNPAPATPTATPPSSSPTATSPFASRCWCAPMTPPACPPTSP